MQKRLTIVVGGYIVGFPLGGMTWHHLNYLLGFHQMGHEVWFLEDSGPNLPYDAGANTCSPDSRYGRNYLEETLRDYGLPLRYCYYSEFEDRYYGMNEGEVNGLLARADLLLCVSGVTPMRESRPRPRRTAVIDTDPVYTQLRMDRETQFLNYFRAFDAVVTFGKSIGHPDCELPTHGMQWFGTQQPIVFDVWPQTATTSRTFTTLGSWEHEAGRDVEFRGRRYRSSKSPEWQKMVDLPRRVPWTMELAMNRVPPETFEQFTRHGWHFREPKDLSINPRVFQEYVQGSAGEFTVLKEVYAQLPSGAFSDRATYYLASGRPVVTQGMGFDRWLPTGEGLFSISTIEEAADALNRIAEDHPRHCAAARRIAEEHFDSRRVLGELLDNVL